MKRFALILAVAALPAAADWTKMSEANGVRLFADVSTYKVMPDKTRRAWMVVDMDQADATGVRSVRQLVEANCAEQQVRILSASFHSQPMAAGPALGSQPTAGDWQYVAPRSMGMGYVRVLCT